MNIHFVGISGSLRKGSFNSALLRAAAELLPEGITMEIASIADIPSYNADLDFPQQERPESVKKFRDILSRADAILLVSPEYNYSIPGLLKNAIDWASRGKDSPLINKPVGLMGATQGNWGTVRMQLAFKPVFQFTSMLQVNKPEVLVARSAEKFSADGKLIDEATREIVQRHLQALKELTVRTRSFTEQKLKKQ